MKQLNECWLSWTHRLESRMAWQGAAAWLLVLATTSAPAAVRYVNVKNTAPSPPYTDWASAATNMQDAVDVALPGDEVVVTNGIYQTGGSVCPGGWTPITNRVVVTKPLTLRSVNGPAVTVIDGLGAVRCVYLTNGAALVGFTLTNGQASYGGGIFCNSTNVLVSNCVLAGNSAYEGGGASSGTLNDCTLSGNSAGYGGGASWGTLNSCTLTDNRADGDGGGAYWGTLDNCSLAGNSADYGGGALDCVLNNCSLTGNSAFEGGGTYAGTVTNCTLIGNSAHSGGGALYTTLNNSILYYNEAINGPNHADALLNYCCTTPVPTNGVGNISADPQLITTSHISLVSPCRGAGNFASTPGVDIDGEPWANPPSIGCDEVHPENETGPLAVALQGLTNVVIGFEASFTAITTGHAAANRWDIQGGAVISNRLAVTHTWMVAGDYQVIVRVYNQSNPDGVNAAVTVHVCDPHVYYVSAASSHPVAPYNSWGTAATNIQDALDVAPGGALVLVGNGVYRSGSRIVRGAATRIAVVRPISVLSLNGPETTVIDGLGLARCVYLNDDAMLAGFTLTNGVAFYGGGACGGTLYDCILARNRAEQVVPNRQESGPGGFLWLYAGSGGGAYGSTLNSCVLTGNSAWGSGGGADRCTLNDCVLTANSAYQWVSSIFGSGSVGEGGGAHESTLNRCTIGRNSAGGRGGGVFYCTVNNSGLSENNSFYGGGGAWGGALNNCTLTGNWGGYNGGGASGSSTLNNCTLTGNWARDGGGAHAGTLNNCTLNGNCATNVGGGANYATLKNCIVYFNSAPQAPNYGGSTIMNDCCTTPLPTNGIGNFTNAPLFVDQAGGNLRLQSNSPCINAGNNSYLTDSNFTNSLDLDGNPRILGGTVDVGAYEFQSPQSVVSYAWLQQYGLPTDGSADLVDSDNDGLNNWREWRAWTDPTNGLSGLRMLSATAGTPGIVVSWQSVSGQTYWLERSTSLGVQQAFDTLDPNIIGQAGTTVYSDTNAVGSGPFFYRVRLGN